MEQENPTEKPSRSRSRAEARAITEAAHGKLRDAIMTGELRPGQRLVEDELAAWLGVSRTPIREVLLRLAHEGHVRRSRGWVVREYEPQDILRRLECRLALEGYAARLAAERGNDAGKDAIAGLVRRMHGNDVPVRSFNELNDAFHRQILDMAANPMLASLHAQTKMNYWDLSFPVVFNVDDLEAIAGQHVALVEAIQAGDGTMAEAVAREHVALTTRVIRHELSIRFRSFGVQ